MESKVRNRAPSGQQRSNLTGPRVLTRHTIDYNRERQNLPIYWIAISLLYFLSFTFIHHQNHSFPTPVTPSQADTRNTPGSEILFSEIRTKDRLGKLVSVGFRPVGSIANENYAVEYLLKELNEIRDQAQLINVDVEIDLQKSTGTFSIKFADSFTSVYDNIQNIIVKLHPSNSSSHSLMVNCHYDSVIGSPGV